MIGVALRDAAISSALLCGDFSSFYVPGVIIRDGQASRLYDLNLQRELTNKFWPSFNGNFYITAYPPFFYAILTPLSYLSPQTARHLFSLLMLALFVAAVTLTLRPFPELRKLRFSIALFSLCCLPTLAGILGGQNTALSMFLVSAMVAGFHRGDKTGLFWSGVAASCWLFKPQYGLIALFLGIPLGGLPFILGAGITGVALHLIASAVLGWNWLTIWFDAAMSFNNINYGLNAENSASLVGTAKAVADFLSLSETARLIVLAVVVSASGLFLIKLFLLNLRASRESRPLTALALLIGPAAILFSPQSLFYDLGVSLLPALLILGFQNDRTFTSWCIFSIALSLLSIYRHSLPVPLFLIGSLVCFAISWNFARRTLCSAQNL